MNLNTLKNLFLKIMLGCLIAAAGLGVVTILIGDFNELTMKALWTIALVAIHCLVSFGFILNNEKQDTFDSLTFFTNVTFGIITLSFITSTFMTWDILPGELGGKLYMLYFVLLFATLHGEILAKTRGKQTSIDRTILANYVFMAIVVILLLPIIFFDNATEILGAFYYRFLAAMGVIDATLTLVVIILHKLYLRNHPTTNDQVFNLPLGSGAPGQAAPAAPQHRGMNIFVTLLTVYLVLQFLGGFVLMAAQFMFSK